jgi:hypothetical protein
MKQKYCKSVGTNTNMTMFFVLQFYLPFNDCMIISLMMVDI